MLIAFLKKKSYKKYKAKPKEIMNEIKEKRTPDFVLSFVFRKMNKEGELVR